MRRSESVQVSKSAAFFDKSKNKRKSAPGARSEIDIVGTANSFVGSLGNSSQLSASEIIMPATNCFPPNDAIHSVKAHEQGGQCIAFSPYGQQVASGGGDGFVRLWNS